MWMDCCSKKFGVDGLSNGLKSLPYHGVAEFNGMHFATILGFARHFL